MQFLSHSAQRVLIVSCRRAANRNSALENSVANLCWMKVSLAVFNFGRLRLIPSQDEGVESNLPILNR